MCRHSSCIRMISNQMPSEARAAASCCESRICCSSLISFHIGVPYSDTSSGGQNHFPSSKGASQSSSLSGSKECLAEEARSRSATCSRSLSSPSASRRPSSASESVRVVMVLPPLLPGVTSSTAYETACQQARQSPVRDLLTRRLPRVSLRGMPTYDLYAMDAGEPHWQVPATGAARFSWEYDDGRDRLLALYQKGKDKQWDG